MNKSDRSRDGEGEGERVREDGKRDKTQTEERVSVQKKIEEEVSDIGQDRTAGIHISEMHGIENNTKTVVRFQ